MESSAINAVIRGLGNHWHRDSGHAICNAAADMIASQKGGLLPKLDNNHLFHY